MSLWSNELSYKFRIIYLIGKKKNEDLMWTVLSNDINQTLDLLTQRTKGITYDTLNKTYTLEVDFGDHVIFLEQFLKTEPILRIDYFKEPGEYRSVNLTINAKSMETVLDYSVSEIPTFTISGDILHHEHKHKSINT